MSIADRQPATAATAATPRAGLAAWAALAAFGAYFCMYGFRKPFTAAGFEGGQVFGIGEKTALVTAQVLGYAASKLIGVRVVAELRPSRRAAAIVGLVGVAEAALLLFAVAPSPWHVPCLFLNGLPLGMVFGLVLGFLEGRRLTEAMAAVLCASFILADGVAKSVGSWLLTLGVTERFMPGVAGLIFLPPLVGFVALLARVPPPDARDVALRGDRATMDRRDRRALLSRHAAGLVPLVLAYVLVTIARSLRADFAPEVWRGLGRAAAPATFTESETFVALAVLVVNGLAVLIVGNRRAFFASLAVGIAGGALMLVAPVVLRQGWLGGFAFMVLLGTGLYLPYVALQTTTFERLLAMTRERGNLGFLVTIADAAGYLAYVAVIVGEAAIPSSIDFFRFFLDAIAVLAALTIASLAASWRAFARPTADTASS
ncbi:MAG TPA: DUF5690 family protein [Isosphaeraceae bacterium]|jgi:hypothetical protein|nr:DUF5690 family protein [Isosphaeraceae bacterium]